VRVVQRQDNPEAKEGEMKSFIRIKAISPEGCESKMPETEEILNGTEKDPMAFLKTCARKEGISFNDRIWAQIEEIVDSYAP
jgi:hypothetical protein